MAAQHGRESRRDYEELPEAPDIGASVQLENEEQLTAPAGDGHALDAGYVPPDRPYALDEDGVTPRGAREGDTVEERLGREQGDEYPDADRSGRLEAADGGAALETGDDMAAVDVGISGGAASAEEAAVHVHDDLRADAVDTAEIDAEIDAERDGAERDGAERIDESPDSAGSAAPASGRRDVGTNAGAGGSRDARDDVRR